MKPSRRRKRLSQKGNHQHQQPRQREHNHAQEARILALYAQLGQPRPALRPGESRNLDAEEQFLRNIVAIEAAPTTTYARLLIADGIELPPPDRFTEETVSDKLWEVIHGLARRHAFLSSTDHLSDLELYRHLWCEVLNLTTEDLDPTLSKWISHLDLLSDGSDESLFLLCRYYDDDFARDLWAEEFPDRPLPEPIDPPCQRDRHLPKP